VIWLALLILTSPVAVSAASLYPLIAFFYNGLTFGRKMATRHACGRLEMRMHENARACRSSTRPRPILLRELFFPPIFLVSLVDTEKRCLHDMLAGVTVVRRT